MNTKNDPFQQTSIALWGPTGAGKDWLFRSFAKELEHYNRSDHDFHYQVGEIEPGQGDPVPLTGEAPLNIPPTTRSDDVHYLFERVALIQDEPHLLSARNHDIVIHNDKGQNMVDSLNDPLAFEDTFQTLVNSQNIFLVLGIPTEETESTPVHQVSQQSDEPDPWVNQAKGLGEGYTSFSSNAANLPWSRVEYQNFIKRLFAALDKTPGRNLAVCLTKSDQFNDSGDPWLILQRRFGMMMRRELEVRRQRHNISVFLTSAAGYLKLGDKVMANFQNGTVRDPKRWQPVNTAAPFFWIFEQIERARLPQKAFLGKDPQKTYLPYPKQRSF